MKAIKRAMSGGLVTVGALALWQMASMQSMSPGFIAAAALVAAFCLL